MTRLNPKLFRKAPPIPECAMIVDHPETQQPVPLSGQIQPIALRAFAARKVSQAGTKFLFLLPPIQLSLNLRQLDPRLRFLIGVQPKGTG